MVSEGSLNSWQSRLIHSIKIRKPYYSFTRNRFSTIEPQDGSQQSKTTEAIMTSKENSTTNHHHPEDGSGAGEWLGSGEIVEWINFFNHKRRMWNSGNKLSILT
jgi:hypothetical protein